MRCADFWGGGPLSFDQLPTLQELFGLCDPGLLSRVVNEVRGAEDGLRPNGGALSKSAADVGAALDSLCSVEVDDAPGAPVRAVLIPEETFSVRGRPALLQRSVALVLVGLEGAAVGSRAKPSGAVCLEPQGYAAFPQAEALALRVWLGGLLCRKERYLALASALCALMRWGPVEADAHSQGRMGYADGKENRKTGRARLRCELRGSTVSEARRLLAVSYGLAEGDSFEDEHRLRLARRVEELNLAARSRARNRFLQLARRAKEGGRDGGLR